MCYKVLILSIFIKHSMILRVPSSSSVGVEVNDQTRCAPICSPKQRMTSPFPANHDSEHHFRPFKRSFVVANVALFAITMYENDSLHIFWADEL